ncbi:Phosphoribosylanthranilate isomerase [Desulfurobacterium thermolithotrophum DSM 11699]|uniref:N-(5'-phosphoribosyl)anthranilate isomerase n=1 Tax=Desulfurobacterium thermolithotrophum (strain DSM 11699 / BSA) TaxID=868864 RepID=F0S316_DESTD|nr:phosphoribosylanthranilate isomerase [Desulfurobacterium thermolithotrophum]ADY73238.1 Phosphoribosylanthranilate isomerase [Desulfurobacterium thermolithotrophum DSM 11699]
MVKVKICGLTSLEDALIATEAGADVLGFILYPKSKRFIKAKEIRKITSNLPPFILKAGVFVNEDPRNVLEILSYAHLDFAQLHGDETPKECEYIGKDRVIKVFRLKSVEEVEKIEPYIGKVRAILLDTYSKDSYGGTGKTFDWEIAKAVKERFDVPLILSGGLNPENVAKAIKEVNPYAIDVSSGVEIEPGKKDKKKVLQFIKSAKCY